MSHFVKKHGVTMDAMFAPIGAMVATGGYIFKIISSITITDKRNYILQLKVPEGS